MSLMCSTYQCPRLASFLAPPSLGCWPFCCVSCVRTGGGQHNPACVTRPVGAPAINPYPSSQPSFPPAPAPAPDPPPPAASPGRPPPAANEPRNDTCGRGGSVDAPLASIGGGDSQSRWLSAGLPSVDGYGAPPERFPARPTRVDCGQGRVEATADIGNGLVLYDARNVSVADTRVKIAVDIGNGLVLYDARNVSMADTRGVVQYASCGGAPLAATCGCQPNGDDGGSTAHVGAPTVHQLCRISGCVRRDTDTGHGNHTSCCDECFRADGRFHTAVCDAAEYDLNVSSSSTVSTPVGTNDTNEFIPGWRNYNSNGKKLDPISEVPFSTDSALLQEE